MMKQRFLGRPSIATGAQRRKSPRGVLTFKKCPVDTFRQKKAPIFRSGLGVRVTYLPGQSPAKYCRRT